MTIKSVVEHTQLPWRSKNDYFPIEIRDGQEDVVCRIGGTALSVESADECEANASFIIEACNSYDHLKEVNKELLEAMKKVYYNLSKDTRDSNILKEAIKKAEGGE